MQMLLLWPLLCELLRLPGARFLVVLRDAFARPSLIAQQLERTAQLFDLIELFKFVILQRIELVVLTLDELARELD